MSGNNKSKPECRFANGLHTRSVEAVVSAPRVHPYVRRLLGPTLLKSINTTHWGIKVGDSYHDLKMVGLYHTKPEVSFAASLAERDERSITKTIPLGHTHLNIYEVRDFAKHRITHAAWYHPWYENCQGYAVNHLASNILCKNCRYDTSDLYVQKNFIGLSRLWNVRQAEYFTYLYCFGYRIIDWWLGTKTDTIRLISRRYPYLNSAMYSWFNLVMSFMCVRHMLVRRMEIEDEAMLLGQPGPNSQHSDIHRQENEDSDWLPAGHGREDSPASSVVWYWNIPVPEGSLSVCYPFIAMLVLYSRRSLTIFDAICWSTLPAVQFANLNRNWFFGLLDIAEGYVPASHLRKGRPPIHAPCEECSSWRNVTRIRSSRCYRLESMKPRSPAPKNPLENEARGPKQKFSVTSFKSEEEKEFFVYLLIVTLGSVWANWNTPIFLMAEKIFLVLMLLSVFAPVTDWGIDLRYYLSRIALANAFPRVAESQIILTEGLRPHFQ